MSRSKESWGSASRAVHNTSICKSCKSSEGEWNMERLIPIEAKKTQTNKFSYSDMTIIHRNGKE